jgi:peptide methionine sulfoxide reductase msrA/msrB
MNPKKLNELTQEEQRVIINKWTERAWTWDLLEEKRVGTFLCKQCDSPLYYSEMKFDSGCGWPSFDDAIDWQVKETADADGSRTEITCMTCGGHLGHVFKWERLTPQNTRHCVNSISMKFVPEKVMVSGTDNKHIATFGGWCYRCVEAVMQRLEWVLEVQSWFMWGTVDDPTYDDIQYSETWHVEVVQVTFDSSIISYQTLLNVFFTTHDPTTLNRQWNDVGTQYASVIFTHTPEQKTQAQTMITSMNQREVFAPDRVVTQVRDAKEFRKWPDYHQDYYDQNTSASYCQFVIAPKVKKLRETYEDLLKEDYLYEE